MRIGFDKADFTALADLWNRFYPERYRITPKMLRQNTVECPTFDWGASCIDVYDDEVKGFVSVKRSPAALYRGPEHDQAHLNAIAFVEPSVGDDLFQFSRSTVMDRGAYRLVFGQDSRHFFPGLPSECGSLGDFLMIQGFEGHGETYDMERPMQSYEPPTGVLAPLTGSVEVRRLNVNDVAELRRFLESEFPGRWTYDTFAKVAAEGHAGFLFGLFLEGRMEGFALTQTWEHQMPIGGAVWHADLGEKWGSLGPIGVSKEVRGRKLGDALLGAALRGLAEEGAQQSIIDWTGLVGFYGKHGFEVSRTYRYLSLSLGN